MWVIFCEAYGFCLCSKVGLMRLGENETLSVHTCKTASDEWPSQIPACKTIFITAACKSIKQMSIPQLNTGFL